jgi:hypothetical protein
VTHERWLGSRWERLVHHPLLFVLEKAGPRVAPVEPGMMSWQADEAQGERAERTAVRARASEERRQLTEPGTGTLPPDGPPRAVTVAGRQAEAEPIGPRRE